MLGELRENLAHFDAAPAVPAELERRRVADAVRARDRLAIILRERRLGIPGINVRRRALRENVNDVLRLRREMRLLRRQRIHVHRQSSLRGDRARQQAVPQQRGEPQRAEAHAEAVEELPARHEEVLRAGGVVAQVIGFELMWRAHTYDRALDGATARKVSDCLQKGIGKTEGNPNRCP